ncbi:MAG: ABC transporter ATP-binding protein, partial [Myxococcota bacterium]
MLELKSVSKVYRTEDVETAALEGIDLEISAGEFVAIMGPSGCGKSTLLNLLGTLDTPSAGSYRIDGESVAGKREKALAHLRRRTIGFVFQSFNLIDNLTVRENVELSLLYRG